MARNQRPVTIPPLIFNVYKPVGPTSADIVQHFKKNLPQGFGKIGHLGTLDPFAEGVLLIAVAGAARVNEYFHKASPKHYRATGVLGDQTNTGDLEGEITDQKAAPPMWSEKEFLDVESALQKKFCGSYWQKVPQFSAAKHCGKPLYEYARQGERVERPKVLRRVYHLRLIRREGNELEIEAVVGTGTYLRSLFEDICEFLGTCGHLSQLVRTQIGSLRAEDALCKQHWPQNREGFEMTSQGLTLEQALPLPFWQLNEDEAKRYRHGQTVYVGPGHERLVTPESFEFLDKDSIHELCWVFDHEKQLCGLGRLSAAELRVAFNLPKLLA